MVKQSCTSATWMSWGPLPDMSYAIFAAALAAAKVVNGGRSDNDNAPLPWPEPVIQIGSSVNFLATSSDARNSTAAPSVTREQSNRRRGYAIIGLEELFKKSNSVSQSTGSPASSHFFILFAISLLIV